MATPPPQLQTAIHNSSVKYGVPADILTGIWVRESGGNFPNNFVNSSGYGGLFGTTNWNGSTQNQSDYAASILANLKQRYGTWSLALYHYSGGAYTSVAGQTTSGGGGHDPISTIGSATGSVAGTVAKTATDMASVIQNIPATIMKDLQPIGIGLGIGLLGVLMIVGGVLVIALGVLRPVKAEE